MSGEPSFTRFAEKAAAQAGKSFSFLCAVLVILVWAVSGPIFHFSDTWQLVINTGTTIVTFLMVFLIQNSQNRDTISIHIKLDELIRATQGAHTGLLNTEEMSEEEIRIIRDKYLKLAAELTDKDDSSSPNISLY